MFLIVKNVFKGRWGNNSRLTLLVNQRIEASCVLILKPEFEKLKGCILDLDKYSLSICVFVDAKGRDCLCVCVYACECVCMRVSMCVCVWVCVCVRERERIENLTHFVFSIARHKNQVFCLVYFKVLSKLRKTCWLIELTFRETIKNFWIQ